MKDFIGSGRKFGQVLQPTPQFIELKKVQEEKAKIANQKFTEEILSKFRQNKAPEKKSLLASNPIE